jgi:hypothetical protein
MILLGIHDCRRRLGQGAIELGVPYPQNIDALPGTPIPGLGKQISCFQRDTVGPSLYLFDSIGVRRRNQKTIGLREVLRIALSFQLSALSFVVADSVRAALVVKDTMKQLCAKYA